MRGSRRPRSNRNLRIVNLTRRQKLIVGASWMPKSGLLGCQKHHRSRCADPQVTCAPRVVFLQNSLELVKVSRQILRRFSGMNISTSCSCRPQDLFYKCQGHFPLWNRCCSGAESGPSWSKKVPRRLDSKTTTADGICAKQC